MLCQKAITIAAAIMAAAMAEEMAAIQTSTVF